MGCVTILIHLKRQLLCRACEAEGTPQDTTVAQIRHPLEHRLFRRCRTSKTPLRLNVCSEAHNHEMRWASRSSTRCHDIIASINAVQNEMWLELACPVCGSDEAQPVLTIDDARAPENGSYVVRCVRCGMRRLDRRPGDTALTQYYPDGYNSFVGRTRGRVKQRIWDFLRDLSGGHTWVTKGVPALRRVAYRATSRLVDINLDLTGREGAQILDVGSGYGDLLLYFKSRGYAVRGVEGDRRAADRAAQLGIRVELEDPAAISLPTESVDVVIYCHSLEHLPSPAAAIEEAARVSKPDAEIHIAVPNGDAVGLHEEGSDWGHLSYPLHFWYFDARSLVSLLSAAGFQVQTVSYRMTWGFHVLLWRKKASDEGTFSAVAAAVNILRGVATSANRRDVLRVVAVKPDHALRQSPACRRPSC